MSCEGCKCCKVGRFTRLNDTSQNMAVTVSSAPRSSVLPPILYCDGVKPVLDIQYVTLSEYSTRTKLAAIQRTMIQLIPF